MLLRQPEEVRGDLTISHISCHACEWVTGHDDVDSLFDEESRELRCVECGVGGFVPHHFERRRPVAKMLPEPLADDWTPIPRALRRHARSLGLDAISVAVIEVLASHDLPGGEIRPGQVRIAELALCSERRARTALDRLEKAGLLRREKRSVRGRTQTIYDLAPLWDRLARIEAAEPAEDVERPEEVDRPAPHAGGRPAPHAAEVEVEGKERSSNEAATAAAVVLDLVPPGFVDSSDRDETTGLEDERDPTLGLSVSDDSVMDDVAALYRSLGFEPGRRLTTAERDFVFRRWLESRGEREKAAA